MIGRRKLMRAFTPDLPPELWLMVFSLLVEPMVAPYKYCTSETFTYYRTEQYRSPYSHPHYATRYYTWDYRTWRDLSLVCRAWANLLGTPPFLDTSSGYCHLRVGVRSIKCSYPSNSPDNNPLELLRGNPHISAGLTTLAMAQGEHADSDFSGINELLDNCKAFPMLRSLRIDFSPKDDMAQFWDRLEKGFPNLISLGLTHSPSSVETITFRQLEILVIWATKQGPSRILPTFSLPRLRYAAIVASHFANSREFLQEHGRQLQSLSFSVHDKWPWSPIDFWELLPNLLTLEIPAEAAEPSRWPTAVEPLCQPLPPIPPTHPLRRLALTDLPIYDVDDLWEESAPGSEEGHIRRILLTVPTIKHLSITESIVHRDTLKALRSLVTKCGITFDVHAVTVPCEYRAIRERYGGEALKILFFSGVYMVVVECILLVLSVRGAAESVLHFAERLQTSYHKLARKRPTASLDIPFFLLNR